MEKTLAAFFSALIVSFLITPFVMKLAGKIGAVDIPKDSRRIHTVPIPRLGGIAIFVGFFAAVAVNLGSIMEKKLIGLIAGSIIIIIAGIYDDMKTISAKKKFLLQILAAIMVVLSGVVIKGFTNPLFFLMPGTPTYIPFGIFAIPVTIFWIVAVTNAVNLIDGLDGLAAGISVISSVTLMIVAIISRDTADNLLVIVLSASLAGGAIGFLPYNFNPAKIFMGDTGAMFLGFTLSVISMMGAMKGAATFSIAVPLLAVGIPIFDTLLAMLRRIINKKPVWSADKGHLHHKLLERGLSHKKTVIIIYAISIALGISAVAVVLFKITTGAFIIGGLFLIGFIGTEVLGILRYDYEHHGIVINDEIIDDEVIDDEIKNEGISKDNGGTDVKSIVGFWDETGSDKDGTPS